jgi:hypothetical protein
MIYPTKFRLISYPTNLTQHVSQDIVREFENILVNNGVKQCFTTDAQHKIGQVASNVKGGIQITRLLRLISPKETTYDNICIFMGHEFKKALFPFLLNKNNHAYFFDAWPGKQQIIGHFIEATRVKNVFFSSKQVTESFTKKYNTSNFHWMPEAIDINNYNYKPYTGKTIDVLSFGRKYDILHNKLVSALHDKGISYMYERKKGHIIFADRPAFIDGLSRSKISICMPSNITNPELAGDVSTMTVRYLQSMASKALVVGEMPDEMPELFGYEPVVRIDMSDPAKQVANILLNYSNYIPLIEQNYLTVRKYHTWNKRWDQMKQILTRS